MKARKKILVAPLDWGLGHATRVIPVIRELLLLGADVLIGSDGRSLALLQKEFPDLKCIRIPGYKVYYGKNRHMGWVMAFQIPKIIAAIMLEHEQLKKIIADENIDAVISDNRYGLYSEKITSIIITHQIHLKVPFPFRWATGLLHHINRFLISRFNTCWIPDYEGRNNLSGDLSHSGIKPANAIFIGPLSRFTYREVGQQFALLLLLSGPEPQRTILEKLLTEEIINHFKLTVAIDMPDNNKLNIHQFILMVRGVTESNLSAQSISNPFLKFDYMLAEDLNTALLAADVVITRPGYSTVMDLSVLGIKAIFIPTPGQPEQEYLANYLMNKGYYYAMDQESFSLPAALEKIKSYNGLKMEPGMTWKLLLKELLVSEKIY